MSMPDNYDLFKQKMNEEEQWLKRRPECCLCGEHIQEDSALYLDLDWYCADCVKENMKCISD